MDYNLGLDVLRQLAKGTNWYLEFATQEARLRENLAARNRYGDTPTRKAERAKCIELLNELTLRYLETSFNDLCMGEIPSSPVQVQVKKRAHSKKRDHSMIKILFLAANPSDTTRLRVDEESRAIDQALRRAEFRDIFEVRQHWAVRVSDLQELLLRHKPDIVHFSGHGSKAGEIVLEDNSGVSHPLSTRVLSQLFSVLRDNIRCVVLNACYSERQAKAIAQYVDCVIGMSDSIGDLAAINFAMAFYQALGYGRDIKTSFKLGCLQIDIEGLDEQDIPRLLAVIGKPEELFFVNL